MNDPERRKRSLKKETETEAIKRMSLEEAIRVFERILKVNPEENNSQEELLQSFSGFLDAMQTAVTHIFLSEEKRKTYAQNWYGANWYTGEVRTSLSATYSRLCEIPHILAKREEIDGFILHNTPAQVSVSQRVGEDQEPFFSFSIKTEAIFEGDLSSSFDITTIFEDTTREIVSTYPGFAPNMEIRLSSDESRKVARAFVRVAGVLLEKISSQNPPLSSSETLLLE